MKYRSIYSGPEVDQILSSIKNRLDNTEAAQIKADVLAAQADVDASSAASQTSANNSASSAIQAATSAASASTSAANSITTVNGLTSGTGYLFQDFPTLGLDPNGTPLRTGHSVHRPFCSTADVIVWVDPVNGNDTNNGATQTTAKKTFASAMGLVPYFLYHKCRIYLLDGTYTEAPVVSHIWMTASRWANFQVIGHTPNNPAYTDTKPQNVVFTNTIGGGRQVSVWSSMPGSNYNTILEGVTIDAFWPYDVTCQVINCIFQNGGGATNNYLIGGHGATVTFSNITFKNLDSSGLVCEATDQAWYHFNSCIVDPTASTAQILSVKNGSKVSLELCGFDYTKFYVEPGSTIMGDTSIRMTQYGIGLDKNVSSYVTLSGGTPGSDTYNEGGQLVVYGNGAAGSNAGSITATFGSRLLTNNSAKFQVNFSNTSGTTEAFRVTNLGIARPATGIQFPPIAKSATAGLNGVAFIDSADNHYKWRDINGYVKSIPTVFAVSAVAVPLTGSTSETTLATIQLPPLSANSVIVIKRAHSATNNANAKNIIARINGTSIGSYNIASAATSVIEVRVANRGATNSQLITPATLSSSYGTSTSSFVTTAIDLSVSQTLTLTAQLSNSADIVTLEYYSVEIINAP